MTTTITSITIKRPNGEIEQVERPIAMTYPMFKKMTEATRAAGRGECLRFVVQAPKVASWPSKHHCCKLWTRDQGCPLHGDSE